MKKSFKVKTCWFRHIALMVSLLMMMSCGNDATAVDGDGAVEQDQVQIYFTIDMAGSTTSTRTTTWGDTYVSETATYNENAIDPAKFQVLVFDTSNNYLDQLDNISYTRGDDNGGTYDVVGTLKVDNNYVKDNKLSCKLVVLANYDTPASLSGTSTLNDLNDLTFSYDNHTTEDIKAGTACIPMFGVATFSDLPMFAGNRTNAGTIYMLRAMAKIRVVLDLDSNDDGEVTADEEFSIASVSLKNCNQSGYIVPNGYAGVSETKELTMDNPTKDATTLKWNDGTFNPCSSLSTSALAFQSESDTEYYVYVPEYDISDGRPQFSIGFDFQIDDEPYTFDFDLYDENGNAQNNETCNIERNHIYTFTIKKKKGAFTVTPDDWTNVFSYEYTFDDEIM